MKLLPDLAIDISVNHEFCRINTNVGEIVGLGLHKRPDYQFVSLHKHITTYPDGPDTPDEERTNPKVAAVYETAANEYHAYNYLMDEAIKNNDALFNVIVII